MASGAGTGYAYDSNGNLATKTEGTDVWAYEWNALNQLTRVTKNSAEQARFSYDPMGRRVEKVAGGVTTAYAYDGRRILREARGATVLKYVHGTAVDEPLAVDDGTALSYFHGDTLRSIARITNAAGAVTLTRQYDAWGNLESGANEPGYAFTGREWDPETALYYYRARYYDPKGGRFISEDPIEFNGGPNFYGYAENQPTTSRDPFGLVATKGCSPSDAKKVNAAAAKAEAAAKSGCLKCDKDKDRWIDTIRNTTYHCVDLPAQMDMDIGFDVCARAEAPGKKATGKDVMFFERAINDQGPLSQGGCGCLQGTLLHEVAHLVGVEKHDDAYRIPSQCFSCYY